MIDAEWKIKVQQRQIELLRNVETIFRIADFQKALKEKRNAKIENSLIGKILQEIVENKKNFHSTIKSGSVFYRARIIKSYRVFREKNSSFKIEDDFINGYDQYNSKEPPINVSPAGRANIQGSSYLYLTKTDSTAVEEVKAKKTKYLSVAKFKTKKTLKIIDLTKSYCAEDFTFLKAYNDKKSDLTKINIDFLVSYMLSNFTANIDNSDKKTKDSIYYVSQYIADFFRKAGYDGVQYYGSHDHGKCLTLFHSHKSYIAFDCSEVVKTYRDYPFYLNNGKILNGSEHKKEKYHHNYKKDKAAFINLVKKYKPKQIKIIMTDV